MNSSIAGPSINGQPTNIRLVERTDLGESRYPDGVFSVVNAAFSHCHPPYIQSSFQRLVTHEQMLEELGPESFTYIVTQTLVRNGQEGEVVVGTGSAVPVARNDPGESLKSEARQKTTVSRSAEAKTPIFGVIDWELKHICVEPGSMRQGLAGHILRLLHEEVLRRSQRISQGVNNDSGDQEQAKTGLRIMITTLKEMNGSWYQSRGYELVETSSYPAGTLGGSEPFSIWHMDRLANL